MLTVSAAALALLAVPAHSDERQPMQVLNGQLQLGDVYARMNLHVVDARTAAGGASAVGNAGSATSSGGILEVQASQHLSGTVGARVAADVEAVSEATVTSATAFGNAAATAACCGTNRTDLEQVANGHANVYARNDLRLRGGNGDAAAASAAVVNAANVDGRNAFIDSSVRQYSNHSVRSFTGIQAEVVEGTTVATASATVNAVSSTNTDATLDGLVVDQRSEGVEAIATADIYAARSRDMVAASAATGNTASAHTTNGFNLITATQDNAAYVQSESYVTLDDWRGLTAVSSQAIGNTVTGGAIGSSSLTDVEQTNRNGVVSVSSLRGIAGEGGVGLVNSVAIGNAVSGFACADCGIDVAATGFVRQVNEGSVFALGEARTVGADIVGAATAIGNTATFAATRPRH
jgi:hypothetical protein